jgi:hypothetical protein
VSVSNSLFTLDLAEGGAGGNGGSGGHGGNGQGGGLWAGATSTITIHDSTITLNDAQGGAGAGGGSGQGKGGGLYIDPAAGVGLDAFTVAHLLGNAASTSNDDVFGSYTIIP